MTDDPMNELKDLWRDQPSPPPLDLDALQRRASRFVWQVRLRNGLEWAAVAVLVPSCAAMATMDELPPLSRLSAVWLSLAALFVGLWLWRYGRARELPDPAMDTIAFVGAHRDQLRGQARLLRRTPLWYFLPLTIGIAGVLLGVALAHPAKAATAWTTPAWILALLSVLVIANQIAARQLERQADALEPPKSDDG